MSSFPCPHCRAAYVPQPDSSPPVCQACGREPVVCDDYTIDSLLGSGGMGYVFGATKTSGKKQGRKVAVKIVYMEDDPSWKTYDLFEKSTKVLEGLDHPSLPRIYAFEKGPVGQLVLVREPFDGGTLEERLHGGATTMSKKQYVRVLKHLLKLLDYLHGRMPPVLHRDIKPSNIMFRSPDDWFPVLVDFDTVSLVQTGPGGHTTIVISPGYTAPEQMVGSVSPASDLYSLGATMIFAATGTSPDDLIREHGALDKVPALDRLQENLRFLLTYLTRPATEVRCSSADEALGILGQWGHLRELYLGPREQAKEPESVEEKRKPEKDKRPFIKELKENWGTFLYSLVIGAYLLGMMGYVIYSAVTDDDEDGGATTSISESGSPGSPDPPSKAQWAHMQKMMRWMYGPTNVVFCGGVTVGPSVVLSIDNNGALHAVGKADGQPLWIEQNQAGVQPVVAAGSASVLFDDGATRCLDATSGRQLWKHTSANGYPVAAAPWKTSFVIVTIKGEVVALDGRTGEPSFTATTDGAKGSSLLVQGDTAYVGTKAGSLYAFDLAGKKERWHLTPGPSDGAVTVVHADDLAVYASMAKSDGTAMLKAFEPPSGAMKWQSSVLSSVAPTYSDGVLVHVYDGKAQVISPLDGGTVAQSKLNKLQVTSAYRHGEVYLYLDEYLTLHIRAVKSGKELNLEGDMLSMGGMMMTSSCSTPIQPVIEGDTFYTTSNGGQVYALDLTKLANAVTLPPR